MTKKKHAETEIKKKKHIPKGSVAIAGMAAALMASCTPVLASAPVEDTPPNHRNGRNLRNPRGRRHLLRRSSGSNH